MRSFMSVNSTIACKITRKECMMLGDSDKTFFVCVFVAVASTVKQALQDSLVQILQPKRRVDILRDVMEAQSQRRPFVITFCGVNGVGKSTNLAKVSRHC